MNATLRQELLDLDEAEIRTLELNLQIAGMLRQLRSREHLSEIATAKLLGWTWHRLNAALHGAATLRISDLARVETELANQDHRMRAKKVIALPSEGRPAI